MPLLVAASIQDGSRDDGTRVVPDKDVIGIKVTIGHHIAAAVLGNALARRRGKRHDLPLRLRDLRQRNVLIPISDVTNIRCDVAVRPPRHAEAAFHVDESVDDVIIGPQFCICPLA